MRGTSRGVRRSVDRGGRRLGNEPRKFDSSGRRRVSGRQHGSPRQASDGPAPRGRRPQHAPKLLAREPGGLSSGRSALGKTVRIGKAGGPKPMMHGREKSGSAIVAGKSANAGGQPAAASMEPRACPRESGGQGPTGTRARLARTGPRAGRACPPGWTAYGKQQEKSQRRSSPLCSTISTSTCCAGPASSSSERRQRGWTG